MGILFYIGRSYLLHDAAVDVINRKGEFQVDLLANYYADLVLLQIIRNGCNSGENLLYSS